MTGHTFTINAHEDHTSRAWFENATAKRVNTDIVLVEALRTQYPNLDLVIAPENNGRLSLLAYASAGFAKVTPLDDDVNDPVYGVGLKWRMYAPPSRRLDADNGALVEKLLFGKFLYKWKDQEAVIYIVDGRDGTLPYPTTTNHYILTNGTHKVDELIKNATQWGVELHDEVWVFDQGWWQKSAELYNSIRKATWDSVILDEGMKKALISDVETFFDGRETYEKLKVPWKRGIIYYGPPGNGKTISIKAMMHSLYERGAKGDSRLAVPTLYVRSLASFGGPEYAISQIFLKARQEAPCYLVFEDLDSIVNDFVRSYFLNEVDGLKSNDGILMVGSTNHLDRLDPGISKRPSRFDRKYYFSDPNFDQRVQYAHFWQGKLKSNKDVDFPDALAPKIAGITKGFSFAYMQEAFIASLLDIAHRGEKSFDEADFDAEKYAGPEDPMNQLNAEAREARWARAAGGGDDPDLDHLELWVEIQKQVKLLREEMDKDKEGDQSKSFTTRPTREQASRYHLPETTNMSRPYPPPTECQRRFDMAMGRQTSSRYRDELDVVLQSGRHPVPDFERMMRSPYKD